MFFSVIVPVYRVEEYLPICIDSVLNQTFDDFELILVNDGSPDNCPNICEDYAKKDNRIKLIHKVNGGLASARRAGIKVAVGDYVFNLDSDDLIENDALEKAYKIIKDTNCEIVSFAYRWVKNGKTISVTDDTVDEGFYDKEGIKKHLYPRLLMNKNMNHISYYLSGKAVKRELLTPHQLAVDEKISLGEDLCCVLPCYFNAKSVYISKQAVYLYTVRDNSLSKEFNTRQINFIEDIVNEISKKDVKNIIDFNEQLQRYFCFMCFTVLAAAAEGNHYKSVCEIKDKIINSQHCEKILSAKFESISVKSKITIYLMKKNCYKLAFVFLNLCKNIRKMLKKG